jgi:hypothetical protein
MNHFVLPQKVSHAMATEPTDAIRNAIRPLSTRILVHSFIKKGGLTFA